MGAVLTSGPIEQAAVEHVRAGGDICLVCHDAERVSRCYDTLVNEVERTSSFARRASESVARVMRFKRKMAELKRSTPIPTNAKLEILSRKLWEFSEQVRIAGLSAKERA